jgi:acyl carrier protein
MPSSVAERIAAVLLRHSRAYAGRTSIEPGAALIGGGLELDSIGLLDALIEIEQEFSISMREEDLTLEVLSSFERFVRHVEARRGVKTGP